MYIITADNKIIHLSNYLVGDNYIGIDTVDPEPEYHLGIFKPYNTHEEDPIVELIISFAKFTSKKQAETALNDLFENMGKTTTWNAKDYQMVGKALSEEKERRNVK